MEIANAQEKVKQLLGDIEHPRIGSYIALSEEVGEVADQIMKLEIYEETKDTTELKGEIADVFLMVLELCNVYGIDLNSEFEKKLIHIEPRAQKWRDILGESMKKKREKHN